MTKRTPEVAEKVLQALREGHAYSQAAAHGGIGRDTLLRWRKVDKNFDERCDVAEGEGIAKIEDVILETATKAEDKSLAFNAAKFILERRKPTRTDYAPVSHNHPFLAVQNNYLNPLALFAPKLMSDPELPALEGEVVRDEKDADV